MSGEHDLLPVAPLIEADNMARLRRRLSEKLSQLGSVRKGNMARQGHPQRDVSGMALFMHTSSCRRLGLLDDRRRALPRAASKRTRSEEGISSCVSMSGVS
jgi:hypothetical protein